MLKEELLWVRTFETIEELHLAFLDFKELYNRHWLIQRHGYATLVNMQTLHACIMEGYEFCAKSCARLQGSTTWRSWTSACAIPLP